MCVCMCVLVTQLCPTLWNPIDCSIPGFLILHYLPEFAQTHVHWVGDAIQPSHPLSSPFSSCPQSFPGSGSFPISRLFTSGGQSIGASALASVLPMNIQGLFLLGLTGSISVLSKGFSSVFSRTKVKSITFLVLSLLYGPSLTYVHDYWKNHSFDYMHLCGKISLCFLICYLSLP